MVGIFFWFVMDCGNCGRGENSPAGLLCQNYVYFVYFLIGYFKLWTHYTNKSTEGLDIWAVLLDLTGASFSLCQLLFNVVNEGMFSNPLFRKKNNESFIRNLDTILKCW